MKKWMYVISVGSMLAIFLFFYLTHMKETEILEQQRKVRFEKEQKDIAETKARNEAKAREDARARAAARAAEEAKKEADKIARWEAEGQKIKDQTDTHNREADRLSKDSAKLEIELDTLRNEKENVNRATFDVAKRVERARIDKQNTEFEIQRMTEMIAQRAASSSLVRMPAPVTSKPP